MKIKEIITEDQKRLARYAKALGHPIRIYIMNTLSTQSCCYSADLSDILPIAKSTLSQHLKELKSLGLIHGEIDGLKVNYCLCESTISKYRAMFDEFANKIESAGIKCEVKTKET